MNSVVIIGTGRVAEALCASFARSGVNLLQVVGRNEDRCREMALRYRIGCASRFDRLEKSDCYIIAVSDNAIESVSESLAPYVGEGVVCHTSGATSIERLSKRIARRGVFYPLQSFGGGAVDLSDVPILVEAIEDRDQVLLRDLARQLSTAVYEVDSGKREKVHLAAVFVNNFVNHIFTLSDRIIEEQQLPKKLLRKLIESTFEQIMTGGDPFRLQTGPARREDTATLQRHFQLLENHPSVAMVYETMSNSILKMYKDEKF